MSNTKFRCAGCRQFFPLLERRRVDSLRGVCSDDCYRTVVGRSARGGAAPAASRPSSSTSKGRGWRTTVDAVPPATRVRILLRDGGRCRWCGQRQQHPHVHHIKYRSEGVDHGELNLISLCGDCHALVHSDKRRFKPLLLALIWITYVDGRHLTGMQLERQLARG